MLRITPAGFPSAGFWVKALTWWISGFIWFRLALLFVRTCFVSGDAVSALNISGSFKSR